MKHYSPSTQGFYTEDIHGQNMPEDVIEISNEEWHALLNEQSQGKRILPGPNGHPIAVDREIAMTTDERAAALLRRRDAALRNSDWLVARHRDEIETASATTLSGDQYIALQRWRAQLRALPTQAGYPRIDLPENPLK